MSTEMQTSLKDNTLNEPFLSLTETILKAEGNKKGNKDEERTHGKENLRAWI